MGLYLCVFNEADEELDGVEVGSYSDYGRFVDTIIEVIEGGMRGSRCPMITKHPDSDGSWGVKEVGALQKELEHIWETFAKLPPREVLSEWQKQVAVSQGMRLASLKDCFVDVDGENLIERLLELCDTSLKVKSSILFQ